MLANAAAPIVGLVDTLIIGRFSSTIALAGIGLGAVIYGIAYWGFGFLRMSTAGLAAQSFGAERNDEVQAHLARAVPLGMLIGLGHLRNAITSHKWCTFYIFRNSRC
jgi:MATE family multidrug resistance protein